MKKILFVLLLLIPILIVFAHEYVLLASKYSISKGDTLELHLFVADGFNIELERPLQTGITKKFELVTENGARNLLSSTNNGSLPVINMKSDFDGLGLFHMERDYARIALPTKKFLSYLEEDHLENIREKTDLSKQLQRERYSRYIKCLVQSGKIKNDTLYKTLTGQSFEILLLQNPYLLHKGDVLQAKVLFMGNPFINRMISARNRTGSEPSILLTARTNSAGICSFLLKRRGDWFIHATQMIPCIDKTDADWESFWASYSFGID